MGEPIDLLYLGRARLHRVKANVIQTLHMVEAFDRLGCRVQLHVPPWERSLDLPARLAEIGIDRPLPLHPSPLLHPRWHFWPFVWRHRRLLHRAGAVYTRVPPISAQLARRGIHHHMEVHGLTQLEREGWLDRLCGYHGEGRIGWMIARSAGAARTLVAHGADPQRVHAAPNGVDYARFANIPPLEPARLADRPRIVYLGRVTEHRGGRVLNALARSELAEVVIVGQSHCELDPRVRLEAPVPHRDVPGWYARADIAVMPYSAESAHVHGFCPLKLFEGMAAGRPILISRFDSMHEWVTDGESALLVDPESPEAWVEAVRQLKREPELAARLARRARELAPRYDWQEVARGILKAIGLPPRSAPASSPPPPTST